MLDFFQKFEVERNGLEFECVIIGFWKEKLRCVKMIGFCLFCIERKVYEINDEID